MLLFEVFFWLFTFKSSHKEIQKLNKHDRPKSAHFTFDAEKKDSQQFYDNLESKSKTPEGEKKYGKYLAKR